MVAGDLQADLGGGGRQDELLQRRRLGLPAEAADPTVSRPADPALDPRRRRELPLRAAASITSSGIASIRPEPNRGVGLRCEVRTRTVPCGPGTAARQEWYSGSVPKWCSTTLRDVRKPGWTVASTLASISGPRREGLRPVCSRTGTWPCPVPKPMAKE